MYIVGKTEDGDTLYWGNGRWHESIEDAESFGVMRGHFKIQAINDLAIMCSFFSKHRFYCVLYSLAIFIPVI